MSPRHPSAPLGILSALVLCSCLDFDAQLERCRDAGVWICAGADARTDAGIDGGTFEGPEGLVCNADWCWDHPRPTGVELKSVWGSAPNDLWVGGEMGTVLHFNGTSWTSFAVDPRYAVNSICGHGSDVYFGTSAYSTTLPRLLKWSGAWSVINGPIEDIHQLQCGAANLWIARYFGASSMAWTAPSPTPRVSVSGGENCVGIAETGPDECVVACRFDGVLKPAFARLRSCDGVLEYALEDVDGGYGDTFHPQTLWKDPVRGVLAGLSALSGEIWARDQGWSSIWKSTGLGDIYAGAPYDKGSIAVGSYGQIVDVIDGGTVESRISTSGNSYLYGVWSPPSGDAWAVGERGCILQRQGAQWRHRSNCDVLFEDFASAPQLFAVTETGLYGRADGGWGFVRDLEPGQIALWERPDGGGFLHLTQAGLNSNATQVLALTGASSMAVVSDERVVILTNTGELVDSNATTGTSSSFDAGVRVSSLVSDPSNGTVWVAGEEGTILRSTSAGEWTPEDAGVSGAIDELAVGFGRVWVVSGGLVATRDATGTWTRRTLTQGPFERVVPIDATNALVLRNTEAALRVSTTFAITPLSPPPSQVNGRIVLRGDEAWGRTSNGGIVRFRVRP